MIVLCTQVHAVLFFWPRNYPLQNGNTSLLLIKKHFSKVPCSAKKRFTFLCGDSGPLVLRAFSCHKVQDTEGTKKNVRELLKLASRSSERETCNEVLYGRAGYL